MAVAVILVMAATACTSDDVRESTSSGPRSSVLGQPTTSSTAPEQGPSDSPEGSPTNEPTTSSSDAPTTSASTDPASECALPEPGAGQVVIYFPCWPASSPPVGGFVRQPPDDAGLLGYVFEQLLLGPTDEEQTHGALPSLPPDAVYTLTVEDGLVVLDFDSATVQVGRIIAGDDVRFAIRFTLEQFGDQSEVRFDGVPMSELDDNTVGG